MPWYVLTGAPGSGKTAILRQLEQDGFAVVEEAATDVIALAHARGEAEPWASPGFADRIVALQLRREQLAAPGDGLATVFFDRSPVCTLALCRFLGQPVSPLLAGEVDRVVTGQRYGEAVFFVRGQGFVTPTAARRISLQDAAAFEKVHEETYRELGFRLIEVPPGPLAARVAMITNTFVPDRPNWLRSVGRAPAASGVAGQAIASRPPTVISMRAPDRSSRRLAVEAAAFGLGYASVLCWASTCLVATFGGVSLASPYWPVLPWLRTDTTGVIAFALAAVSLSVSKYLRLRRIRAGAIAIRPVSRPASADAVQAIAETAAVLATGLVAYLSLNVVTHSVTLRLQLTHLWPWPSEGTVRVIALGICVASVAATRYLRSRASSGARDQAPAGDRVGTTA